MEKSMTIVDYWDIKQQNKAKTTWKWHTQLIAIFVSGDGDEVGVTFNKFVTFLWDSFQMTLSFS